MFRSPSVSKLSMSLLRGAFYYANLLGVIDFRIQRNRKGHWIAFKSRWLKSYCLICRIIGISCFFYAYSHFMIGFDDFYSRVLHFVRFSGLLLCNLCILLMQIFYGQQIRDVTNRFLKLFGRIRALTRKRPKVCYGSNRELALMLVKIAFLAFEVFAVSFLVEKEKHMSLMCLISNAYLVTSACMVLHISFIGYLTVGVLYFEMNKFVQFELRSRLQLAEEQPHRRHLKKAKRYLDESVAIYDEIQQSANQFQRLFDATLFLVLMYFVVCIVVRTYDITRQKFAQFLKFTVVAKTLTDVILMALAVQGAVNGSQMIPQFSFENYIVVESRTWDKKMEMFLSRLGIYELHVRPLGLFELSNEFILFILSSLLTYLTYLIAL